MINTQIIEYPELKAKIKLDFTLEGYPTAEIYTDKKSDPNFNYRFRTTEHRDKYIEGWKRSRASELIQARA